jgi:hypothetical protein
MKIQPNPVSGGEEVGQFGGPDGATGTEDKRPTQLQPDHFGTPTFRKTGCIPAVRPPNLFGLWFYVGNKANNHREQFAGMRKSSL